VLRHRYNEIGLVKFHSRGPNFVNFTCYFVNFSCIWKQIMEGNDKMEIVDKKKEKDREKRRN
jgi:hypothetical protein